VPTQLVDFNPKTLWTQEQFEQAFPKSTTSTAKGGGGAEGGVEPHEGEIPATP